MPLEFWLSYLNNIQGIFFLFALLTGIASVVAIIVWIVAITEREREAVGICKSLLRWLAVPFFVCCLVAALPNIDDMWKVRISLIKFELASPENVKAAVGTATETIERIGKKLECKYIGGQECENGQPKAEEKK